MSAEAAALEAATIRQQCKALRMPTIAAQCAQLDEQAVRERRTHLGYLEALLQAELEEREQRLVERRIREARLPRMKTLEEFDFGRNPKISAQQIHELATGDYIAKAEPIIFYRRQRHRQDPSADRPGRRRLPAETPGALRHRGRTDQRDGRGQASVTTGPDRKSTRLNS